VSRPHERSAGKLRDIFWPRLALDAVTERPMDSSPYVTAAIKHQHTTAVTVSVKIVAA